MTLKFKQNMPYQIVFAASEESELELLKKGFKKESVWIKSFQGSETDSEKTCEEGDADFFKMENKPYQFVTTSFWGACVD